MKTESRKSVIKEKEKVKEWRKKFIVIIPVYLLF